MTDFKQDLLRARSHFATILALVAGFGLILWLDGVSLASESVSPAEELAAIVPQPLAATRALTPAELDQAAIAWRYFQNNTPAETGLVGSVDDYPSTSRPNIRKGASAMNNMRPRRFWPSIWMPRGRWI